MAVITLRVYLYSDQTPLEPVALWALPNAEILDAAPGSPAAAANAITWMLNHTTEPFPPPT